MSPVPERRLASALASAPPIAMLVPPRRKAINGKPLYSYDAARSRMPKNGWPVNDQGRNFSTPSIEPIVELAQVGFQYRVNLFRHDRAGLLNEPR
jgi:hypothetical protein